MERKYWVDPIIPRDPLRIVGILALVESVWKKVPDYRLGQLIFALTPSGKDPFYLEDDELKNLLQKELDKQTLNSSMNT